MRLFSEETADGYQGAAGKLSVKDLNLPVLCVSQFTLYGQMKGNKPDFRLAMTGDQAREFYHQFLTEMKQSHQEDLIKNGEFGAYMQVQINNDGPVTINLESEPPQQQQKKEAQKEANQEANTQ